MIADEAAKVRRIASKAAAISAIARLLGHGASEDPDTVTLGEAFDGLADLADSVNSALMAMTEAR